MKTISLVGRPNVGKSSLFNLLSKKRNALVSSVAGVTRDRNYATIQINEQSFNIIDTGGIDKSNSDNLHEKMIIQTELAIDESDIIFFIVDGIQGITPADEIIAKDLRKKNKPILLIINKSESKPINFLELEFSRLGFKDVAYISTAHRQGIYYLDEFLSSYISIDNDHKIIHKNIISISILGKPNVGKSTFLNTIIGEERFISEDYPGTTRDSISTFFNYDDEVLRFIDTAGIRKKGKVNDTLEKFSVLKSLESINEADACILIIDSTSGLTSQDLQIYGYIINSGKPLTVVVNKWDLMDSYNKKNFKIELEKKLNLFENYEVYFISALNIIGLDKIIQSTVNNFLLSQKKVSTPKLNLFLKELMTERLPPIVKGIRPKLKYIHQGNNNPPTFIIHGNHLTEIKKDYLRFIEKSLVKKFLYRGTPIKIVLKENENPFGTEKIKKKVGLVTRRRQINYTREKLKNKKN